MPKVFISYSHDSEEHAARVLKLADALRRDGVEAILDQYNPVPEEGWPLWMGANLEDADFVLMVCTPTYFLRAMRQDRQGIGLGVQFEGTLIYNEIYHNPSQGHKYLPIFLDTVNIANIPKLLRGHTYFRLKQFDLKDRQYKTFYRHLTKQPATPQPVIGPIIPLSFEPNAEIPLRGSMAYIICDRDQPSFVFRDAIKYYLDKPKPYGVHCYILEGTLDDCPNSFIKRLLKYELDQLASERKPLWWKTSPGCFDVAWEYGPTSSPEQAIEMLKENIISGLIRNDTRPSTDVISDWEFNTRLLRAAQNQPVIAIGHYIIARQWHKNMEQLLTQYLQLLAALPDTAPLILLFFTVDCEPTKSLLNFLGLGRTEYALEAMRRILGEEAKRQSTVRYSPLGKLDEIDEQHVARMLRNIDINVMETQIQDRLRLLFGRRKRVKMSDVERHFKDPNDTPKGVLGGGDGR